MIVWVDDRLFLDSSRDVDRVALLRNTAQRRHTLIISTSPNSSWGSRTSPGFDAWVTALPNRLREEIRMLRERTDLVSVSAITRGAKRVLVCAQDPGTHNRGCRLSLEEAVRALAQPLNVLVENQINDAAFIRRIMPPVWRKTLDDWERLGKLRFENGGGLSVMCTLIAFHCEDIQARLAFGLPADLWRLVHFFIFDHDGETPDSPSEDSRRLWRQCQQAGLSDRRHRLERRDQEHYLPVEVLREIVVARITNEADRVRLLGDIEAHSAKGDERHFSLLPNLSSDPKSSFFKNEFSAQSASNWPDDWFERDGAWPEMTRLAEQIASAM